MSKILKFDVTLNHPTGIYHPGDALSGTISLKIRDDIPCYGIYLWVLGQADVSWADKPGSHKTNFEYEIYIQDCITLWGREQGQRRGGENLVLTAGAHEYSFQFRLPDSLSSSFESQDVCKGRVHYLLRARLESPDEHVRQTRDKTLIILSTLDLNKEHRVAESVQMRRDKYVCCCCCKSGPISCALRLDRTGYVPGEDINLDAEIQNFSRKDITHSYVTMQQIVHFHAAGVSKTCCSDIFRISGGKIKPGDNALFHDIIHIPPLPPSRLDGCNLIDIDYVITVGVMPASVSNPIEVTVPIIIGTVPLAVILPPGMLAKVSPSYSRYSHSSGEIEDYDANDYQRGKYQHVYTYYKSLYKGPESSGEGSDVT